MINRHFYFFGIFILLFSSCSWVGSYIKQVNKSRSKTSIVEGIYKYKDCKLEDKKLAIYASDMQYSLDDFLQYCMLDQSLTSEVKSKRCFLSLAIYQMLLRPDIINPFSQVLVVIQHKDTISLLKSDNAEKVTYWEALWTMAKSWDQSSWLSSQLNQWVKAPIIPVKVTKKLADAIRGKRELILSKIENNDYKSYYSRGDELISEGEDLPYSFMLNYFSTKMKTSKNKMVIERIDEKNMEFIKDDRIDYSCNFAVSDSMNGKVNVYQRPLESSLFAVHYGDWFLSLAAYESINLTEDIPNKVLAYFLGENTQDDGKEKEFISPKYCYVKNTANEKILMTSFEGRDPGQYLASSLHYIKNRNITLGNLQEIMTTPRHLLLLTPLRLAFEVDKANEQQVQNILNMGVPVFNEKSLGLMQYNGYLNKEVFYVPDRRGTQDYCSYDKSQRTGK